MRTAKEIRAEIRTIKKDYAHVLKGKIATIQINAPRALMQIHAEAKLYALHWTLGESFKSKLKGLE